MPVPTVLLTSHAGKPGVAGEAVPPGLVQTLLGHIWQGEPDLIISGYLGTKENGILLAEELEALNEAGESIPYLLDPIIGDDPKGLYVPQEVAQVIKEKLVPLAALVTPNRFETEYLTGLPVGHVAQGVKAAQALLERGPRAVLITSCCLEEGDRRVCNLLVTRQEALAISAPYYPSLVLGAGDMLNAALAVLLALGYDLRQAAPLAVALTTRGVAAGLERGMETVAPVAALWGLGPRPFLLDAEAAQSWWQTQGVEVTRLE